MGLEKSRALRKGYRCATPGEVGEARKGKREDHLGGTFRKITDGPLGVCTTPGPHWHEEALPQHEVCGNLPRTRILPYTC